MDLVERLRPPPHEPFPQLGQMPVRLLLRAGQMHGPHPLHAIPAQQTLTIDPQQFAQGIRIAPVGLVGGASQRLDHQHLVTALILLEPFHQPVVKSADLDDRHVLFVGGQGLMQLLTKLRQFGPARADLAPKDDVAIVVAQ